MEWMYNVTNKWNGTIFDVSMQFTLYIAWDIKNSTISFIGDKFF